MNTGKKVAVSQVDYWERGYFYGIYYEKGAPRYWSAYKVCCSELVFHILNLVSRTNFLALSLNLCYLEHKLMICISLANCIVNETRECEHNRIHSRSEQFSN